VQRSASWLAYQGWDTKALPGSSPLTFEFFKKLKLHERLQKVQFQLFEKLTQIEREKPYDF